MKFQKCSYCEKPSIGQEILGCCGTEVCGDHADPRLLALEPGGRLEEGAAYFRKYHRPGGDG